MAVGDDCWWRRFALARLWMWRTVTCRVSIVDLLAFSTSGLHTVRHAGTWIISRSNEAKHHQSIELMVDCAILE